MSLGTAPVRARVTPERAALAALIMAALLVLASGPHLGRGVGSGASSGAVATAYLATPSPSLRPDETLIAGAIAFDGQVLDLQSSLRRELAGRPVDSAAVEALLRQVDVTVRSASESALRLAADPVIQPLASRLTAAYSEILSTTADALRTGSGDLAALRTGTTKVIEACAPLVALTTQLQDLLGPAATAPASPSGSPSAFQNQLRDPGFDASIGGPWSLGLSSAAFGTMTADLVVKVDGTASARIDIGTPSPSWAGIAVTQGGLTLDAGERYAVSIAIRAAATRDVRLAIVAQTGQTYDTRIITATPAWTTASFEFTALVSDPDAVFEIDLGHSSASVWLDDAAFGRLPSSAP